MWAGLAQRARIVLLADEGVGTSEIVHRVGVSKPTVIAWKRRFTEGGITGLDDRPNRPLLAKHLGVSHFTVSMTWKKWGLQPWRVQTFSFSPTRSSRPRSVTSSGSTSTRRARRSCSASPERH
jgi:hypothetical protein